MIVTASLRGRWPILSETVTAEDSSSSALLSSSSASPEPNVSSSSSKALPPGSPPDPGVFPDDRQVDLAYLPTGTGGRTSPDGASAVVMGCPSAQPARCWRPAGPSCG